MTHFRIGALDFSRTSADISAVDAIWATIELAPLLESLGYDRYWLGEHYNHDVGHSSPDLLLPVIAGITDSIRVGTAGVLLRFYSPFKVAANFRLLHTIYPNRIDLGIARGHAEPVVERLLLERPASEEISYGGKVAELLSYLRGTGEIPVNPTGVAPPEIWTLGSKSESANLAGSNGTSFCLALFLDKNKLNSRETIDEYRATFRPSPELLSPKWRVAVAGVCASTQNRAEELAAQASGVSPSVVGDPVHCRMEFEKLAEEYETTEFIFLDVCKESSDRIRSYELLAGTLGLEPKSVNAAKPDR
jgi:luciferase family oxidoreductase group 1